MANITNLLRLLVIIMVVYSGGMTIFVHTLPTATLDQLRPFQGPTDSLPDETINEITDSTFLQLSDIPLINVGALVFYTGNIFIDFLVNFVTALPQIFVLLLNVFSLVGINIDVTILLAVQAIATIILSVSFVLGLIELWIDIRSGRQIGGIV